MHSGFGDLIAAHNKGSQTDQIRFGVYPLAFTLLVLPEICFAQGLPSSSFGFDGLGVLVLAFVLSIYLSLRLIKSTNTKWMWIAWPVVFSVSYGVCFIIGMIFEKLFAIF